MENQNRRKFIKTTGAALLVTSGISVFGLFTSDAKSGGDNELAGGRFYDDGYYDDGYYNDGYTTGIDTPSSDLRLLNLYPNPSDGNFNLVVNVKTTINADIFIQDISGKTLVHSNHNLQQGANLITYQADDLANGIYLLSIVTANGSDSHRLVIEK